MLSLLKRQAEKRFFTLRFVPPYGGGMEDYYGIYINYSCSRYGNKNEIKAT